MKHSDITKSDSLAPLLLTALATAEFNTLIIKRLALVLVVFKIFLALVISFPLIKSKVRRA